ncbi:MAG: hypothetical protein ACTHMU_03700 [Thermomicrobiales bacterium]
MATSGARLILDTARAGLATLARVTHGQQARACMEVRTALDWMARYIEAAEQHGAQAAEAWQALEDTARDHLALTPLVAELLAALAAEEAHAHQPAPDHNLRAYCLRGQELRETVRRLRREAEAALQEETAA